MLGSTMAMLMHLRGIPGVKHGTTQIVALPQHCMDSGCGTKRSAPMRILLWKLEAGGAFKHASYASKLFKNNSRKRRYEMRRLWDI
jgi:hypothetical protein